MNNPSASEWFGAVIVELTMIMQQGKKFKKGRLKSQFTMSETDQQHTS